MRGGTRTPRAAAGYVVAAGLLLTTAYATYRASANASLSQAEFGVAARRLVNALSNRVSLYEYGLRGARGAIVAAGDSLSRQLFLNYHHSRDIDSEFPGARGFGFIRVVPDSELDSFLEAARLDGAPDFSLRVLSARTGDHYIIQYIEPVERNRQAVGLDIATEPLRRAACDAAATSGKATLTGPITLVQAENRPLSSFLFLLPIYRQDQPHGTPEQRRRALFGWSYAPLVTEEILRDLSVDERGLRLTLYDVTDEFRPQSFYSSDDMQNPPVAGLHLSLERPMFGRTWRIELNALPSFVAGLHLLPPGGVFALGLVLSLLSGALAYVFEQARARGAQVRVQRVELAAIIDNASDAIVSVSAAGRIASWNDAATRLFGYSAAEALGHEISELCPLQDGGVGYAKLLQGLADGARPAPFDATCRRRDGTHVAVSIAVAPTSHREQRAGMALTYRDIQERKAREHGLEQLSSELEHEVRERTASLEAARRDLQTILDAVPSMIGYWDRDLRNRFANQAYVAWFGVSPEALKGMHMRELLGEMLFEVNRPYAEAALRGELQHFERVIPSPDGTHVRHSLAFYLPDIVEREVRGFYALVHDVTELHNSRERLAAAARENESLLRTLDHLAVVFVAQPDGSLSQVNDMLCRLSGVRRSALIGQDHRKLSSDVHSEAFWTEMWETLGGGAPWRGQLCIRAESGADSWLDAIIAPFYDNDGQLQKYVCIGVDITAAKLAASELARAKGAAEAANAAKTEFITNISHEIRTPLNAIIGMTYVLERSRLDADQQQQLHTIQGAGRSLLSIVNDVLDLSRIEAGGLVLENVSFDPRALSVEIERMFASQAEAAQLDLLVRVAEDVPKAVWGDLTRTRQILTNLIGNALKFTERGSVALFVTLVGAGEGPRPDGEGARVQLRFSVRDTGPGIAPEVQARLFAPFTQGDASTTRRYGGSGLGLSIVKRLAESMGGEVGVRSVLGEGSSFWAILPYAPAAGVESTAAPDGAGAGPASVQSLAGLRLLVVDDSDINRDVATHILQQAGAEVCTCEDGVAALSELRARAARYDAVLMDIQMPQMDGNEATRRVREELGLKSLVIIGLTAGALSAERQRALDAGMNDFLTKPFEPRALIARIRKCVGSQASGDEGVAADPAEPPAVAAAAPEVVAAAATPTPSELKGFPQVPGLDVHAIAAQLDYDRATYAKMLSQLLRDGEAIAAPDRAAAVAGDAQLAADVHRLRGAAGALGASAVHAAAGALDEALKRAHPEGQVQGPLQELRARIRELADVVAPWIALQQALAAPVRVDAARPNQAELQQLLRLLRERDLEALGYLKQLSPGLRVALGPERFAVLESALGELDFAAAIVLVEQVRAA